MKEIPFHRLVKTITLKRLVNAGKACTSYLLSALLKKPIVWGRPFILTIEPTNVCNLRCPLCVTGNGRLTRKAGFMDWPTYQQILDKMSDWIFYLLLYHQGEPFLNKLFLKMVEYAKAKNICVTTSTNGHYLNKEMAQLTVASGLDAMIVSIDGTDQKTYETYRVGGQLKKVLQGVENLVAERERQSSKTPLIYLQFILMQHNLEQLETMQHLTRNLGADKLLCKTVQVETLEEAKSWLPKKPQWRRYDLSAEGFKPRKRGSGPCPRPWSSTLVNWDGTVVPCCFDKNGLYMFGTLKNQELDQTWKAPSYNDFRDKMLHERNSLSICSNCSQGLKLFI